MRALSRLLLLPACAAQVQIGPAAPDPTPPAWSETAINELLVTRPSDVGLATTVGTQPAIYVNGREVGRCRVGRPLVVRLPDGDWIVTARTASGEAWRRVEVYGGEQVAMSCGVTGALSPRPELGPVVR